MVQEDNQKNKKKLHDQICKENNKKHFFLRKKDQLKLDK